MKSDEYGIIGISSFSSSDAIFVASNSVVSVFLAQALEIKRFPPNTLISQILTHSLLSPFFQALVYLQFHSK